ncbi:MAG: hypothetical protein HQ567_03035, partial [Candidatus Nealsonbacteria bacterium]|nr:hypothetical protein [Candidatus Nealsonbacteria bacterium]
MTGHEFTVTADSTLEATSWYDAQLGSLFLQDGALATAGSATSISFTSTTITGTSVGVSPTVPTDLGPIDGGDLGATITVQGDLLLDDPAVRMTGSTFDALTGTLGGQIVETTDANPFGTAKLGLGGGNVVLSANSTGAAAFDNEVEVTASGALIAKMLGTGADTATVTLGGTNGVSVADGQTLSLSSEGNYSLNVAGTLSGVGTVEAAGGIVNISGAGSSIGGLTVSGGTATLAGENMTVDTLTVSGGVASTAEAGVKVTGSMELPGIMTVRATAGDFSVIGSDLAAGPGTLQLNDATVLVTGPPAGGSRFIRVRNNDTGANRYLHIGEIEAFVEGSPPDGIDGDGTSQNDVALASQGATFYSEVGSGGHGGTAAAYDGDLENVGDTWTRTNVLQAEYVLDLGQVRTLNQIRVWQRGGTCCGERLQDFTVSVLSDDAGSPGEVLWFESHSDMAPRPPGYADFVFTIPLEIPTVELGNLTGTGTVDGLIDITGGIAPGGGGGPDIGKITVGDSELAFGPDATYNVEVSVATAAGGPDSADNISLALGSSTLMLDGELNVSSVNDRNDNSFFGNPKLEIVSNPATAGGSIGWLDKDAVPDPVMMNNRFATVTPALAAPGEPSPHLGHGAFLRGVLYDVVTEVNPPLTRGVELDVFIALGGDADGDAKVWLSDWAALR